MTRSISSPAALNPLFAKLWKQYSCLNSQAGKIHDLLAHRGEILVNDHVAFRTLDMPGINMDDMAKPFLAAGYVEAGAYAFPEKFLSARHWQYPGPNSPKIFISQLHWRKLSAGSQSLLLACANQIPPGAWLRGDFCASGRPWQIRQAEYEALARESEYAAWLAAFGFLANHFTVAAHRLKSFASLRELSGFLKAHGFRLNAAGGEIKGSPGEGLEQASTMAAPASVGFRDGVMQVPACYYEFAWRFPVSMGARGGHASSGIEDDLFHGFLEKSADKIFESTNRSS